MNPPYDFAVQSTTARHVAYVSVIADKVADRHQIVVHAATEAALVTKLYHDHGLLPCPVKEDIFRTPAECARIRANRHQP